MIARRSLRHSASKGRVAVFLFCAVILLALLMGTETSLADLHLKAIDRLVIGTTMEVKSLSLDDSSLSTLRHITSHQSLVRLDENGAFIGELAESWHTQDARTWTFTLRRDALWHDGRPVTAKDVQYTIETLTKFLPVYRSHFGLIERVATPDAQTVVLTLRTATPRFLVNLLVLRVLPAHVFGKSADPRAVVGPEAALGSGPFVFTSFDSSAGTMHFRAFERYWRGAPRVRELVFRFFKNTDTMMLALRKGEIDLPYVYASGIEPFYARNLAAERAIEIMSWENLGVPAAIFFNVHRPPAHLRDFRRALALAINYQEIVTLFSDGRCCVPNEGFVPRGSPEYIETAPLIYDPALARRLLDDLGMVDTDKDGVRDMNGKALEVEMIVRGDLVHDVRLAELLRKYFQAVGVRLKLHSVDAAMLRTLIDTGRSHTALLARTTPWGMMMWAGCGSGYFDQRYLGLSALDDPKFQSLVDQMNGTLESTAYREAASALQLYYAAELPAIPLYWNRILQPYRKRIQGWKQNPMYGILSEESWFSIGEMSQE